MPRLDINDEVGSMVAALPARARVFEAHGIDYCCNGKIPLAEVCTIKGIDAAAVIAELESVTAEGFDGPDPASMTLTELADHIEATHHVFLRNELPRLRKLIDTVVGVHGAEHPWLADVRATFSDLVAELEPHMMKEEQILFPMIREIDGGTAAFPAESVRAPISVMEHEHDVAGAALLRLRTLTSDYTPPQNACNSFRVMLDGLHALETDTHMHIHKENNVLFRRATND
ncbi:MAG: iron-sulfur cluster repair di-iron protein [Gemmatimonadales bacterium]